MGSCKSLFGSQGVSLSRVGWVWWNAVIMYPYCMPHFLQHDLQQGCVPQYFSVICDTFGCLLLGCFLQDGTMYDTLSHGPVKSEGSQWG